MMLSQKLFGTPRIAFVILANAGIQIFFFIFLDSGSRANPPTRIGTTSGSCQ
jgi:hypothetical protein